MSVHSLDLEVIGVHHDLGDLAGEAEPEHRPLVTGDGQDAPGVSLQHRGPEVTRGHQCIVWIS